MSLKSLIPWRNKSVSRPADQMDFFEHFRSEVNRLFDDFFTLAPRRMGSLDFFQGFDAFPKINIFETEKELKVTAELPGVDEKDLHIHFHDHTLTIGGERREEKESHKGNVRYCESSYGSFSRTIPLNIPVDENSIEATFKKGVLTITMQKAEDASYRKIPITVS